MGQEWLTCLQRKSQQMIEVEGKAVVSGLPAADMLDQEQATLSVNFPA
jgi:hypothetical protein